MTQKRFHIFKIVMHEDSRSGLISCIQLLTRHTLTNILKSKELFSLRGTTIDPAFAVIETQDISGLAN